MQVLCPNLFSSDGSLPYSQDDTVEILKDLCDEMKMKEGITLYKVFLFIVLTNSPSRRFYISVE